ncbi:hypothetical protein ACT453_24830, partial [Bacillus sp. D-CC]
FLAALLNLILTPLFVVGAPIIIRVTMESSHTLYGIGMGLIDFATIVGALSIGFFAKKLQMQTLYYWMILIALLVIPMALSVTIVGMIWLSCTLFIKGIVINISKIADKKKARQLIITSIFKPIMPYNIPPNTGATILDNAC